MADSATKKSKKNKRNAKSKSAARTPPATSAMTETLEETLFWYNGGSDEKSQNMAALKLEILGPYLFSRNLLCDEAMKIAKAKELLPKDSLVWPTFFDKSLWKEVTHMCQIMSAVVGACEKDQHMYQSLLTGTLMDPVLFARKLRDQYAGDGLRAVSDEKIALFYSIIKSQGCDYGLRARETKNLAVNFFHSLTDKVKLVDPVKDRGNSNFKQLRFKAAIADYSTAIKLCPFSPVLYCNRALCYLRNEDYWNACVDSYRALVLHPTWEKPYYRCADAWHRLGDVTFAIEINEQGCSLAASSADLHSQLHSFTGLDASNTKTKVVAETADDESKEKKTVQEKVGKDRGIATKVSKAVGSVEFEKLHCPELDPRLSCAELRKLCNNIKLEWCSPASYFSAAGHLSRWEELEPEWMVPIPPITDPLAEREPMMAKFDEIWCPLLADVEESLSIIPPTFQYFSDGTVMHSALY